jgi:peptidyl-tRNA hydrolase, PTH1 family
VSATSLLSDWLRRLFGRGPGTDPLAALDSATTRLVVGLGNPGPEYAETRHNVGFRVVDEIARRYSVRWQDRRDDLKAFLAVVRQGDQALLLVKPQTFMNRSGEAVSAVLGRQDMTPNRALIVYDDMDLPFGALRLRERGSPGTHNGMRSVVSALGTEAIARLRIGISQASPGNATDHVLSEFEADERDAVAELVSRASDAALAWAFEGAALAMNRYNKT